MNFAGDLPKLVSLGERHNQHFRNKLTLDSVAVLPGNILVIALSNSYNDRHMAARTCLLCGKALSRIWAGTEEDFCSREHRNQYRLRRGMDRLLEANKVASVMRRRESTRQIPASVLRAPGQASVRGFFDALHAVPPAMVFPATQWNGRPAIANSARFTAASPAACSMEISRHFATAVDFTFPSLRAPRPSAVLLTKVTPAGPATPAHRADTPAERRTAATSWRNGVRPAITGLLARAGQRTAGVRSESRPPRRLTSACRGKALRVSTSAGFHLPERKPPSSGLAAAIVHGLVWPDVKPLAAASAPRSIQTTMLAVETVLSPVRTPHSPEPDFQRRFRWPEAFDVPLESRNAANAWRISAVPFAPPDEYVAKERK